MNKKYRQQQFKINRLVIGTHVGEYLGEVGDHLGDEAEYGAIPGEVGDWLKVGEVGE